MYCLSGSLSVMGGSWESQGNWAFGEACLFYFKVGV